MTTTIHRGVHGTAWQCDIPDGPRAAQTVCQWLITAPIYHPLWSQYALFVVRLDPGVPGFREPYLQFPGATHELCVVALDPDHPATAQAMGAPGFALRFLNPVNHAHQFTATDEEMRTLADLAAHAVVDGALNPETGDAPEAIREAWLTSMVRTLAHLRGEEHAP